MSKFIYRICFFLPLLIVFSSSLSYAQLLWEVSGKNSKQKSYLFGTVHVGDKRVIDYASNVYPYMDNSLTVAGELDLNVMTSIMAMAYIMSPKDSTLSKLLTKEEYQEIKPYLVENIGELAPFLDMVRPVFVMAMLQEKEQEKLAGANEENATTQKFPPLDMHLQNRARRNDQNVMGLETVKEQMTALNSTPIDKQAKELYNYIKAKSEQTDSKNTVGDIEMTTKNDTTALDFKKNPMETLISLYLTENIELLHDQISKEFEEETYQSLIVKRNLVMVKRMEEQMNKKPSKEDRKSKKNIIFAAVGAGHLGGEKGMVNLLKEAGYTLKPIFFNKKQETEK
ncbi:TraB/GumN family protein [Bernardetia sp.]|uniref:TraB/GumN family protein n=1 Tax=Bernardetia sp. TaxID=1937974 RepID=UPI0025C4D323|nr:TraB/GumN family protein [Bernardetia sp.]